MIELRILSDSRIQSVTVGRWDVHIEHLNAGKFPKQHLGLVPMRTKAN
jgi:hypothetical protein